MRGLRWLVYGTLGAHLLLALLLLGKDPLLIRAAAGLLPRAPAAREGMTLAVYGDPQRSGKARPGFAPGALARLESPRASLDAFAIWQVRKAGTYSLVFECDDRGAVFVDGHRVLGRIGRAVNNVGRGTVRLKPGPHLLVVSLTSGEGPGWFTLKAEEPGGSALLPLPPGDLHPLSQRSATHFWRWLSGGLAWLRGPAFWVTVVLLLVAALALQGAASARQVALNTTLIVVSSLAAVVAGEMAIRLVLAPPQRVSFRGRAGERPAAARDVFMIPTERGFRHNPNSEVVVENTPARPGVTMVYRTNSLGYRNRELGVRGTLRILFLGDSITFGLGVNAEETFVRMVEERARRDGKAWETVNAGVNSLGTNGEIAVLTETGLSVKPDVVILGFYLNDFLESPGIYLTVLPGILDRSWLAHRAVEAVSGLLYLSQSERESLDSPPMLKAPDEIFAWRDEFTRSSTVLPPGGIPGPAAAHLQALVIRHFEDWGGAFSPHVWTRLQDLLAEYVRLAHQHRIRPAVLAFPVRYQVEPDPLFDYPQRRLQEIAGRLGVPYLDLLPRLRAAQRATGPGQEPLFLDHCHLTPRGNEVVAEAIYGFLSGLDRPR